MNEPSSKSSNSRKKHSRNTKENHNMKKIPFATSNMSKLLIASLLCTSFALAQHNMHSAEQGDPGKLVQIVRNATKQYLDVNNATAAGYGPFLGCVSGQDHGAMGVHYVNGTLLNAGQLDATQPQALIYEPQKGGAMQLVGVEYILFAAPWLTNNNNTPPVLDGQVFQFVDSPNRFNIPAFFELHVWAWQKNPQGAYVDWNNDVTCANQ
jgi:hypothetical protein